ncbi:hypothetical protein Aduo_003609 [Ancylostoma duodenale]
MVMLFHFLPSYFPNGYIGVDIFFVISGFLIAMIVYKEDNLSFTVIVMFYYKRIKRIFPLYYVVVISVLLSLLLLLPRRYQAVNMESAWKAIAFTSNLKEQDIELDYQRTLLGAEDLFVHTWSLSVELQWYLLLPIIFIVQRFVTTKEKVFFTGVALCSGIYYTSLEKYQMVQFYSMCARIWQFVGGVIAFLASKTMAEVSLPQNSQRSGKEEKEQNTQQWLLPAASMDISTFTLIVSLAWIPFPASPLRISVTISCALLIYMGTRFVGIMISMVFAITVHHLYEVKYLKWPPTMILLLVVALAVVSVGLYYKLEKDEDPQRDYPPGPVDYSNIDINDAAWNATLMRYLNVKESNKTVNMELSFCTHRTRFITEDIRPRGYCSDKNGTGNYHILVIGNSYACNQADMVYNSFKSYIGEISVFCLPGCEVMTKTHPAFCRFQDVNYTIILRDLRPNVIFVLSKVITAKAWFDVKKPIDHDRIFNDYMRRMIEMEEIANKIYLLQALPSCVQDCTGAGLAFTKGSRLLREIEEKLIIRDDFFARQRISEVEKRCRKCEVIDYHPLLVDGNGHYLGYNPETNLMYLDGVHHFNRFGKERIQLLFDQLAKDFKRNNPYNHSRFKKRYNNRNV